MEEKKLHGVTIRRNAIDKSTRCLFVAAFAVIGVPAGAAQKVADDLVDAGVRIIFNYSEGLLDVPSDVTVHTSNPAVELLHALYFHLA